MHRHRGAPGPQPHWQARKVLNSGGSGEDDVEVGLFRGPELPGVSVEPEHASRVVASSSGFIFMEMANRELSKVISVVAKLT